MDTAAALAECVLDFIIKSFIILPDDVRSPPAIRDWSHIL